MPAVNYDDFADHFRAIHRGLRKRGELTVEDAFNKNDVVNLVTEGIREGIQLALNANQENEDPASNGKDDHQKAMLAKIDEMQETINRLQNENKFNNQMQQQPPVMQRPPMQWQQPQFPTYNGHPMCMPVQMRNNRQFSPPPFQDLTNTQYGYNKNKNNKNKR